MPQKKKIFWLASYPKSGNTLARLILQAGLEGKTRVNTLGDICPSWHGYIRHKMSEFERLSQQSLSVGAERKYWDYLQEEFLRDRRFQSYGENFKFLKIHHALLRVSGQLTINPDLTGGIIYFVRNPIDVAKSLSEFDGVPIRESIQNMMNSDFIAAGGADEIKHGVELRSDWGTHVASWTQNSLGVPMLVIRYEDFVANPTKHITDILNITQINSRKTASEIAEMTSFANVKNQEKLSGFREAGAGPMFFAKARIGSRTSAANRKRLLSEFGEIINRFDYQPFFQ